MPAEKRAAANFFNIPEQPMFLLVGQAGPSLGSAAGKHFASVACRHTLTETVFLFAMQLLGLICSKHEKPSFRANPAL